MRGLELIMEREFASTLRSRKFLIVVIVYAFSIIAGSYGAATLPLHDYSIDNTAKVVITTSHIAAFFSSACGLIISYDSITKERSWGTEQMLLTRPIPRSSIFFGKVFGPFIAIFAPLGIVNCIALLIIDFIAGAMPPAQVFAFTFMPMITALIFIVLLNLIAGGLKRSGQVFIYGFVLWLLFTIFWPLIPPSIASGLGIDVEIGSRIPGSEYWILTNRIDLFSPVWIVNLVVGGAGGADASDWVAGVPWYAPLISALLWVLLPLCLGAKYVWR